MRHPSHRRSAVTARRCRTRSSRAGPTASRGVLVATRFLAREPRRRVARQGPNVPVAFYGRSPAAERWCRSIRGRRWTRSSGSSERPARRTSSRSQSGAPTGARARGLPGASRTSSASNRTTGSPFLRAVDDVHAQATDSPDVSLIELDPAYILHTSGSTGQPKLILHTHYSAMSFVDWAAAEYALTSDDRLTNHSSHHTCFATFDYYAAARAAATTVILTPAALMMPGTLSALLERERVTVWYSVPAALVQLSLRGDLEPRDLRTLRWVLFAGETFPARHLRRLREQLPTARFSHVYGSTEVNVCTFYHLPDGPLPDGPAADRPRVLDGGHAGGRRGDAAGGGR